jgi:hypothetical protein
VPDTLKNVPDTAGPDNAENVPDTFAPDTFAPENAENVSDTIAEPADGRLGRREAVTLGTGLAAAVVVYGFGFTRFVASALVTLFHELGHAAVGWLLGEPSLPAFDFVYGGGYTHRGQLSWMVAAGVAGVFVAGGWYLRRNPRGLALVAGTALLWLGVVVSPWRRELAIGAAGHLSELLLAGVFFYRALSPQGAWHPSEGGGHSPGVERPLSAFVGFFVQIHALVFAWRLLHDPAFLAVYLEGKGGMLMNDLESVALDLTIHLGVSPGVEGVAGWLLGLAVLPLPAALLLFLTRGRWQRWVGSLLTPEP